MDSIITSLTSLFSGAMDMASTVGSTVTSTPLLLVFVLVPLVGLGVGLFKRLININ